jgi:hypothetical protein
VFGAKWLAVSIPTNTTTNKILSIVRKMRVPIPIYDGFEFSVKIFESVNSSFDSPVSTND